MPNFKAKKLKKLAFPFEANGVCFLWKAENEKIILVFTRVGNESFFLQITKAKNEFVVKADKHSKTSNITALQKALQSFKDNFCDGITNQALAFKKTALLDNSNIIVKSFEELLAKLQGKIYIEIGFGSGRHLLFIAKQNPDILMIGIEIYSPALSQVAKLVKLQGLENILLIQSDARLLLSVLPSNSVEKIFLHFPVPWEKKPHRRVMGFEFAKECARVLKRSGKFELRTDSVEYFDFTLKTFLEFDKPKLSIQKNKNLDVSSKYEDRWKKEKRDIYDLIAWNFCGLKQDLPLKAFKAQEMTITKEALANLAKNFTQYTFKGEDFFLHLEGLYKTNNALVLKIAFGAFNKAQHSYLLFGEAVDFVFKEPFWIEENIKALEKLKEILNDF